MKLLDLTLFELSILVKIAETQSLREGARQLNLAPAHVSKALKRLESKTGIILLKRSSKGMILTPQGTNFYKNAKKLVELSRTLATSPKQVQEEIIISIASISFINTHLLPECVSALCRTQTNIKFRLLEVPTSSMIANGIQGAFEMCLHLGSLNWPKSWTSVKIGKLKSGLYARANHPLLPKATEEDIQQHPFVIPTYWSGSSFKVGEDHCPIPVTKRRHGHEVSTAITALGIILHTDQLAYLPQVVAEGLVKVGQLGEILVDDWGEVGQDLYLSVDSKAIKQTLRNNLVKEIKKRL